MEKKSYKVIGLMSGTSLDGLDICYCLFENGSGQWTYKIIKAQTIDYSNEWRGILSNIHKMSGEDVCRFDFQLGELHGNWVRDFMNQHDIEEVDFIASHGHTVFHRPPHYTLQISNGAKIAATSGLDVICDFRVTDVSYGGEGAPLVPIGDELLFHNYDYCINLGGIANYSYKQEGKRLASDICFANMPLNYLMNSIGKSFDEKGLLARSGKLDANLLNSLLSLSFEGSSLGKELFEEEILPLIEKADVNIQDALSTMVEYCAISISNKIKKGKSALVTGGGVKNDFLMERLRFLLPNSKIIVPEEEVIDFKEALIFAFLGVLRVENKINSLSEVTKASKDSVGGAIFKA